MNKAVLVFAHKAPDQINLLIKQLLADATGLTDIYIHMDANHNELRNKIIKNEHIILIEKNVAITWGNDSMVRAMLASFRQIVNSDKQYDYFVICTGQDLQVKSNFDEYLANHQGNIYLDIYEYDRLLRNRLERGVPKFLCRYAKEKYHPIRMMRGAYLHLCHRHIIPKRKIRYDYSKITFYHCFNWSAMPFEVLQYMVTFLDSNPGFMDLFYNVYLPEDGFMGTIIMNSKYKDNVVFNPDGTSETIMYHPELVDAHCQFLSMDNVKDIEKSGCFFARKFDISTEKEAVDYYVKMIERG